MHKSLKTFEIDFTYDRLTATDIDVNSSSMLSFSRIWSIWSSTFTFVHLLDREASLLVILCLFYKLFHSYLTSSLGGGLRSFLMMSSVFCTFWDDLSIGAIKTESLVCDDFYLWVLYVVIVPKNGWNLEDGFYYAIR